MVERVTAQTGRGTLLILGYRLMVGHQVLVLSIEVRILVPQPLTASTIWSVIMQPQLALDT